MSDSNVSASPNRRKLAIGIILLVILSALGWLSFGSIGENLVYYWTPSELRAAEEKAYGALVRLGGQVKKGTIQWNAGSSDLRFTVTDGTHDVAVHSRFVPPQMFREEIGVVVEGRLSRGNTFESERLLVKHGNEYKPPKDAAPEDVKKLIQNATAE